MTLSRLMPRLLLLASGLALGAILLPFWGAILWSVIIALLFVPLYRRLLPRLGQRRNTAAALVMGVVLVIGVLPFALLTASLAREAANVYQQIDSGAWRPAEYLRGLFDALPAWIGALLERLGVADFDVLQRRAAAALAQGTQFIASQALSIGLNTFDFVSSLGITLYLAFFLIRDGDALARAAWDGVALAPAHQRALIDRFVLVVGATVKGSLLVAAIQGTLGGLAFWALGVQGALLWAVLMGFLSLLPAIGAALVWLPVAGYFLLQGDIVRAAALTAWGVLVIGLVDNLLRPVLVGRQTRMADWLVMITTFGGMALLGINGFLVGPLVAAIFIAAWHIVTPPAVR